MIKDLLNNFKEAGRLKLELEKGLVRNIKGVVEGGEKDLFSRRSS